MFSIESQNSENTAYNERDMIKVCHAVAMNQNSRFYSHQCGNSEIKRSEEHLQLLHSNEYKM